MIKKVRHFIGEYETSEGKRENETAVGIKNQSFFKWQNVQSNNHLNNSKSFIYCRLV